MATTKATTLAQTNFATTSTKLDDFGTPDDNTDLNATTSRHGLLPKFPNNDTYLKGDGTWTSFPNLSLYAPLANPDFTGTVTGVGRKIGTFTFEQGQSTGSTITLSLGFSPTSIEFICYYGTTLTSTYLRSHGWAFNNSSTSQYVQHAISNTMQLDWCISTDDSSAYNDGNKNELKVTAWGSNGPTLTHTLSGAPSTTHTVVYIAYY